ncbi:MAG: penicillin acylase family protein, partial [Polyangiaceae bacterium]|nr:penicillin acylase family protein [Polyangiaceae bacterium]
MAKRFVHLSALALAIAGLTASCDGCSDDDTDPGATGGGPASGGGGIGGSGGIGGEGAGPFVLGGPVDIVRDEEGVAHIYGGSDADVFYASGYMQATDRLFQMDLQRRRAYGRRAEVLGPGASGDDALIRALTIPRWGKANQEAAKTETPEAYELCRAWTAGVNARIDEVLSGAAPRPTGFDVLGYDPEHWDEADMFTIGKAIVFSNANQLEFDVLATLIDDLNPGLFAAVPFYSPLVDAFIVGTPSPTSGPAPRGAEIQGPHSPASLPPDVGAKLSDFVRRMKAIKPGASNNWAVSPDLTDTGKSMIAGDPHQPLQSPSLFWMHHMNSKEAGGTLDVVGWSFVGTPGVSIGHNDHVAWTATTNYPDVTDLYSVEDDGAGNVKIGDTWMPITSHEETIEVGGDAPVTVVVEEIEGIGVLLPDDIAPIPLVQTGFRVLFQWTGFRPTHEPQGFLAFDRATTLAEYEAAVDTMELASFNFIAADADGITYRSSPIVPDRGNPATAQPAYKMMNGSVAGAVWSGAMLGSDKMPRPLPGRPYLVSANNDPFGFTADGSLTNDPWYFGAYYDPGTRAGRIEQELEALSAAGPITIEDMQALQTDTYSLVAEEVVADLAVSWAKVPTDDTLAEFRNRPELDALMTLLTTWDRRMERDRAGALAFEALVHFYAKSILADDMSFFFEPVLQSSPTYIIKFALLAARVQNSPLLQEGKDLLLLRALDQTATFLTERYGAVDTGFTWGDFHETQFWSDSIPEYFGGGVTTDGAEGTVNVSEGQFFAGADVQQKHVSGAGAIYRMTATFDDDGAPRAFFNMPRGAQGEPDAPFFDDRTADWVDDRYTLLRFRRADVDAGQVE